MEIPPLFVLGAPDPEMESIEGLIAAANATAGRVLAMVGYAVGSDGKRVTPAGAYAAGNAVAIPHPVTGALQPLGLSAIPDVVLVEGDVLVTAARVSRCDHHRPGDPGFGRPPAEFMAASSLGQVIRTVVRMGIPLPWPKERVGSGVAGYPVPGGVAYIAGHSVVPPGWTQPFHYAAKGWVVGVAYDDFAPETGADPDTLVFAQIPQDLVLCAAADHCLGAAYRGECPGVDPDALMHWRAESRAKFQKRPVEAIMADVEKAAAALLVAPRLCGDVRDMRRPSPWPELPEAATRLGVAYVSGPLVDRDGRRKFTGSGTEAEVRAVMAWMADQGLTGIYGDPTRGFCGGYEIPSEREIS